MTKLSLWKATCAVGRNASRKRTAKMPLAKCKSFLAWIVAASAVVQLATGEASAASSEQPLYTFCSVRGCTDGSYPESGVVVDNTGNLYGTTNAGGVGLGVVFRLTPGSNGTWAESVLYIFSGLPDGEGPNGLTLDSAGNLYGTTIYGGGAGNCTNGGCGTVLDKAGHLFGTTNAGGGPNNGGIVFAIARTKQGLKEIVLHRFAGNQTDGSGPYTGSLAFDQKGNLYGTTAGGGTNGLGTVFRLSRTKSGVLETILYSFLGGGDGLAPYTGVTVDAAGNLYGTTSLGGNGGDGTIFGLKNTGGVWSKTELYSFSGSDGSEPLGNLVFDSTGSLYGTAALGGSNGTGTGNVFKVTP